MSDITHTYKQCTYTKGEPFLKYIQNLVQAGIELFVHSAYVVVLVQVLQADLQKLTVALSGAVMGRRQTVAGLPAARPTAEWCSSQRKESRRASTGPQIPCLLHPTEARREKSLLIGALL